MSIFKETRMSKTRGISGLSAGLAILAAGWFVTGTFRLAAAPQIGNDSAGVSVDIGGAALLHRSPVGYPESARQKRVQGTVIVEATLDSSGNVADAHVLSGPDELRKAALLSVLQWHFQNAAAGTRTVSISFQLPDAQKQPLPPANRTEPPGRAQTAQQKRIQAESEMLRPQAEANLQGYLAELRRPSSAAGSKLKSIAILGLSHPTRDELLARLPVHEGDTLADDSVAKTEAAIQSFDEHLTLVIGRRMESRDGATREEITFTIRAPGAIITSNGTVAKLELQ
jgi:TonB family protein